MTLTTPAPIDLSLDFKPGDKVQINNPYCDPAWNVQGTVVGRVPRYQSAALVYDVIPDSGKFAGEEGHFRREHLTLIPQSDSVTNRGGFVPGDRVVVTTDAFRSPCHEGASGTVVLPHRNSSFLRVLLDGKAQSFPFRADEIAHISTVSAAEAVGAYIGDKAVLDTLSNGTVIKSVREDLRYVKLHGDWFNPDAIGTYNFAAGYAADSGALVEYTPTF